MTTEGRAIPILAVEDLVVSHGRLVAVHGASFVVEPGGRAALLGLNGAGKSSLLAAIAGLLRPKAGRVILDGEDVTGRLPDEMVRRGLALVPEQRDLFVQMSVAENLAMGAFTVRDRAAAARERERVLDHFPALRQRLAQPAYTLSGGEQQMLAIGRALLSRPRVLLLDEPSLGLAPKALAHIVEILMTVNRESGTALVLVEQNTRVALGATERAYLMESGRITFNGASRALIESDAVRRQLFALT